MTIHPGIRQRPVVLDPDHIAGPPLEGLFTHPFFRLLDTVETECKGRADLFDDYDRRGRWLPPDEQRRIDDNKDEACGMCRRCPIWFACLEYAVTTGQSGLWAGTDDQQRAALLASSNDVGGDR